VVLKQSDRQLPTLQMCCVRILPSATTSSTSLGQPSSTTMGSTRAITVAVNAPFAASTNTRSMLKWDSE
jgi:hypothetical protein